MHLVTININNINNTQSYISSLYIFLHASKTITLTSDTIHTKYDIHITPRSKTSNSSIT